MVFERFGNSVNSINKKLKLNETQIRTITLLGDILLPKLMSGEVRDEI